MFGNNNQSEKTDFIIVYDKLTKQLAKNLYNKVAGKYTCCVWNKEEYKHNEPRFTNNNKVIFFDKDLVEENLNGSARIIFLEDFSFLRVQGNQCGICLKSSLDYNVVKEYFFKKYGLRWSVPFIWGIWGLIFCAIDVAKITKQMAYMIGADEFFEKYLDLFMKGELK